MYSYFCGSKKFLGCLMKREEKKKVVQGSTKLFMASIKWTL